MKNFTFTLESLFALRIHQEGEKLMAWAKALQEAHAVARECEVLRAELQQWQAFRRAQQQGVISVADLRRNHQAANEFYVRWLTRERLRQGLERRAVEAFQTWREANRKEEILRNLRGRALTRWNKEREQQEQKEIDERATFQMARRQQQAA